MCELVEGIVTVPREGTDERCPIIMVRHGDRVLVQQPTGEAMVDKTLKHTGSREMLEENVGAVTPPGVQGLRGFNHHAQKRAWERFNDGLLVNSDLVAG